MSTPADLRARLVSSQQAASAVPIIGLLGTPPAGTPVGYSAWAVGSLFGDRHIVIMPTLDDNAPAVVLDRVVARVLATATGCCPLCGRAAGVDVLTPGVVDVRHDEGCPATFGPEDSRWFPALHTSHEEDDR
ncbi:hypothetical protein RN51_01329 [Microbacterium oxydans]|uniref:Uncharacterized protein n=1 Tax=Microbacterium oxydans TaxID=82380 RepID=A0A0F0KTI7_9MICO|nr:hypothetical protein [Microbacterium oxydans]KJL23794.1 hypothetical protein RN51_01329 [Microbacterium oxydans]